MPIIELKTYISTVSRDELAAVAARCGTSSGHLRNVACGTRPCAEKLAALLERETGGAVTRKSLRPDDWSDIWPELSGGVGRVHRRLSAGKAAAVAPAVVSA